MFKRKFKRNTTVPAPNGMAPRTKEYFAKDTAVADKIKETRSKALQELVDQAQEHNLGYDSAK